MALSDNIITENVWFKEWKELGRQEGEARALRLQIQDRFGPVLAWAEDRLRRATPEELERWLRQLLDAEGIEAIFA